MEEKERLKSIRKLRRFIMNIESLGKKDDYLMFADCNKIMNKLMNKERLNTEELYYLSQVKKSKYSLPK